MTEKDVKKLIIAKFPSVETFKQHQSDSDLTEALCFVPYTPPDNTWKQAFKGSHNRGGATVCTLPNQWKECVIYYTWLRDDAGAESVYIINGGYTDLLSIGREIYIKMNGNQIVLQNGGDEVIREVWWR